MTRENTDKLRMAAANGIQFEFKGSQGRFSEYLHVLDIVGAHQKSKIFL
jgi:hypothetical protein